jgi:carboxymethylenebutenolidase
MLLDTQAAIDAVKTVGPAGIPLTDVEIIKTKRPDVEVYVYPGAQHGFHCDERASYDKTSADIAWPRSLDFFAKHLR